MTTEPHMPTVEQLLKAAPLFARASVDVEAKLYLAGAGDESGDAITPEMRDELLAKLAAGKFVAIDADILAFEQRAGVPNRNFVRFRDGGLIAMGATGKGKPFLRDHRQSDSLAAAGRILSSKTTKVDDGQYEMRQRVRLTAAWAAELALRDLLFGVSIGWEPTGSVECSVHEAPIGTECYCWPGARLAETTDAKGNKKFEYNRAGTVRAEWIYTDAELIETSMCPIGAVKLAGFEGVRAALSAVGFDIDAFEALAIRNSTTAAADPNLESLPTKDPEMTTPTIVVLTEAQAAHLAKLSTVERDAFLGKSSVERDAIVLAAVAADPIVFESGALKVRKSDGEVALAIARQADAQQKQLAAQAKQLELATEATTLATLRMRVTNEIGHLAATEDVKIAVLRALDGIADEKQRDAALAMLKAADALFAEAGKAKGANPASDPTPDSPEAKLAAAVKKIAAEQKVSLTVAEGLFFDTDEGAALYAEMERAKSKRPAATA